MKPTLLMVLILAMNGWQTSFAQGNQPDSTKAWSFEASTLFYFVPDNTYVLPILKADKGTPITALAMSADARRVAWADEDGFAGVAEAG